eukprot:scaffold80356_cov60-Phaeocystis_antarctica.AAC.6
MSNKTSPGVQPELEAAEALLTSKDAEAIAAIASEYAASRPEESYPDMSIVSEKSTHSERRRPSCRLSF